MRETETAAQSDDVYLIKPASDPALALAMMHVVIAEGLHDDIFIANHTIGFNALIDHVKQFPPSWAAPIPAFEDQILQLARTYAQTKPAMMVIGGSSLHKGLIAGWRRGPCHVYPHLLVIWGFWWRHWSPAWQQWPWP